MQNSKSKGNLRPSDASASIPGQRIPTQLTQYETDLSDFIENVCVALHWVADDGTILWANKAELKLLGYSAPEYIGHNIAEFHLDQGVVREILERLERREALNGVEARLRSKDGSERYVTINSNIYCKDDRFVHTCCITDITEQKKIAEVHERLSAIVESSDDAIISKDLNGIILSWNRGAERIFGYTADEMVGRHISMLVPPDYTDEIPRILARLARNERIDHYETKRKTKDGKILTVSLSVSPLRDATGTVIGASKVARDITERVRQDAALREANTLLRKANADLQHFTHSVSHDLQEPLRTIMVYAQLLQNEFGEKLGESGDQCIGYITDGAKRLESLLKNLRVYTQVSTVERDPVDLVDAGVVLNKAITNLQAVINESGAVISSSDLPAVPIRDFQLEQLFQNLIANAIRYRSIDAPQIHIAARRSGQDWLFSVQDNGIGIEDRFKEQIFAMFKRLHSSAKYPGTGMGLAICQRIVERSGGRIWLESEPGRGSTFFFTIPSLDPRESYSTEEFSSC